MKDRKLPRNTSYNKSKRDDDSSVTVDPEELAQELEEQDEEMEAEAEVVDSSDEEVQMEEFNIEIPVEDDVSWEMNEGELVLKVYVKEWKNKAAFPPHKSFSIQTRSDFKRDEWDLFLDLVNNHLKEYKLKLRPDKSAFSIYVRRYPNEKAVEEMVSSLFHPFLGLKGSLSIPNIIPKPSTSFLMISKAVVFTGLFGYLIQSTAPPFSY